MGCAGAFLVSSEFWSFLITSLKKDYPDIIFIAETLGCTPVQIQILSNCGFDYIFNSSKWWNFNDSWCLEQYSLTRNIAPSISFPESHDTPRLMSEVKDNITAFLQRMYFEAIFSKGFMITTGFEFGFRKQINTVSSNPDDWEDTGNDFTGKIKKILKIKDSLEPLHEESQIQIIDHQNWMNVFCFVKECNSIRVFLIINKDVNNNQKINIGNLEEILRSKRIKDYSPEDRLTGSIKSLNYELKPGEIKIFASEENYTA